MTTRHRLTSEDREFFRLVAQATFSNPFSERRTEADLQIAGGRTNAADRDRIEKVIEAVAERVDRLERKGAADLRLYSGEEREALGIGLLFDAFHRFLDAFDRLTVDQIEAGDRICPVPFAGEALDLLGRRGFPPEDARRYFAIFYQLRRAYYFMHNGLVGQSPSMRALRSRLWSNVFTENILWYERYLWNRMEDFSTLLLGETGTGKGAAAAALGRSGFIPYDEGKKSFVESFMRSFISVSLSQFPESLIESELFGHRKGSFSGAIDHHEGVLARCRPHGAIFIDEIGDVPPTVQIKLLQVLQERVFSPVGSHEKLRFRGRVIAATNRPLDALRKEGAFREDFFYRLCSDVITVPPLRVRLREDPDEMDQLLRHLVRRLTGQDSGSLAGEMREALARSPGKDYPWPGNVRELEQAVRRILIAGRYEGSRPEVPNDLAAGIEAGTLDAESLLSGYCRLLYQRAGTYEEVARKMGLDRRTVKKYIVGKGSETAGRR